MGTSVQISIATTLLVSDLLGIKALSFEFLWICWSPWNVWKGFLVENANLQNFSDMSWVGLPSVM